MLLRLLLARFVTSGSVEEDILERARQKMILDHLVIQKMNASGQLYLDNKGRQGNKAGKMFKEDDLKAILRFGAEDLFKDKESGEESEKKLENMDIDEILARAEKVGA
jgi:chromodomain-helicase-DNA-binding protein 1